MPELEVQFAVRRLIEASAAAHDFQIAKMVQEKEKDDAF